jgi:plastocyanin
MVVVVAASALCVVSMGAAATADPPKPATHAVAIEGVRFQPEVLTIKPGDSVVWVNKDPFPHTATSKDVFDSHEIASGKSWKFTARKTGEFGYVCALHPTMKGTLRVK